MPESNLEGLKRAESLRRERKFQEALQVIKKIEKKGLLTPGDQLSLLISKGKILTSLQQFTEAARIGESAYRLSQALERVPDTIMALIFKSQKAFYGQFEEAMDHILEAETLLNSIKDVSPSFFSKQRITILYRKSWIYYSKIELNEALKSALECLEIQKTFKKKSGIGIAYTFQVIGFIYVSKNEYDVAIDYASKSIEIFEEIGELVGTAGSLSLLGLASYNKGDINQALSACKKSLSYGLIGDSAKLTNYNVLGYIYSLRGELDRALRYCKRASSLAEKINDPFQFITINVQIGSIYVARREYEHAIKYLQPSLMLAKKNNYTLGITISLWYLLMTYFQMDSWEEYQETLDQYKEYGKKLEDKMTLSGYRTGKALMLIKSGRSRNRAEAEKLLTQIVKEAVHPIFYTNAACYLCEFYLEELRLFNEPEILNELNPLITQLLEFAERQKSYAILAETKLLQAKLALIQLDIEASQRLLTEAQRIADLYGLNYAAQKISSEHDNLLGQIKVWEEFKEKDTPLAELLKLASVDGVLERLQGRRAIEPPELIEEEPIVLLIMDKSGTSFFNHPFRKDWDFEWLFSSFMSAFDTFSSQVFSESIDRIKIGENVILINPIESFLVCYVIKGQSYPGLQKLNRFSDAIKNNTEIWANLNNAAETGEVLELNKPESLGAVVNEIFT